MKVPQICYFIRGFFFLSQRLIIGQNVVLYVGVRGSVVVGNCIGDNTTVYLRLDKSSCVWNATVVEGVVATKALIIGVWGKGESSPS